MNRGFQKKTIEKNIRDKLNQWAKSLGEENEELQEIIRNRVIVTGGAIASMLMGEAPNDYDVYFSNKQDAMKVADFYLGKFLKKSKNQQNDRVKTPCIEQTETGCRIFVKSMGFLSTDVATNDYQYFETTTQQETQDFFNAKIRKENNEKYYPVFFTDNAITLSDGIQLILRFTGNVEQIHENFDFVHCKNYYKNGLVYLDSDSLESILTMRLKYIGSLFPICSIFRIRKFMSRGWKISAGECFKICYDISKLDLEDPNVLKEQLLGVDYAYFREVISLLSKELKTDKQLDRTYLFELVDRCFDENVKLEIPDEYE